MTGEVLWVATMGGTEINGEDGFIGVYMTEDEAKAAADAEVPEGSTPDEDWHRDGRTTMRRRWSGRYTESTCLVFRARVGGGAALPLEPGQ